MNTIPYCDIPDLIGPLNGVYYHMDDRHKAICNYYKNQQNQEIPVIFKYMSTNIDSLEGFETMAELGEYQKNRYEWIYIMSDDPNDTMQYRKIFDTSCSLPTKYEMIRRYLHEMDPLPIDFLREAKMADQILYAVSDTRLARTRRLSCRVIVKNHHAAILFWNSSESFTRQDDLGFLIHVVKSDGQNCINEFEVEGCFVEKKQLDYTDWDCSSYSTQQLELEKLV